MSASLICADTSPRCPSRSFNLRFISLNIVKLRVGGGALVRSTVRSKGLIAVSLSGDCDRRQVFISWGVAMSHDMVLSRRRGVPSTVLGQRGVAGVAAVPSSGACLWQLSQPTCRWSRSVAAELRAHSGGVLARSGSPDGAVCAAVCWRYRVGALMRGGSGV